MITALKTIRNSKNEREAVVFGMLAFLWEYEGDYVSCIDAFCFLLITNGHDLFDLIRRKYVKSLEEIRNVDVSIKLTFLEEHNFGIFKREKDRILRNKIAHHDFLLDESGRLHVNKEAVDISIRFSELHSFVFKVFKTLYSCLDEC